MYNETLGNLEPFFLAFVICLEYSPELGFSIFLEKYKQAFSLSICNLFSRVYIPYL